MIKDKEYITFYPGSANITYSINNEVKVENKRENIEASIAKLLSQEPHRITKASDYLKAYYDDKIVTVNNYRMHDEYTNNYIRYLLNEYKKQVQLSEQRAEERTKKNNKRINRSKSSKLKGKIIAGAIILSSIALYSILIGSKKDASTSKATDYSNQTTQSEHVLEDETTTQQYTVETTTPTQMQTTTENPIVTTPPNITTESDNRVYIPYEINNDTSTYNKVKATYGDLITKYSNMYGLSSDVMMAVACQESRGNQDVQSAYATGLMQVENIWKGHDITAFNHETGDYETFHIGENTLSDVEGNIKSRCMITSHYINMMNGNPLMGLQSCIGEGNMAKILNAYHYDTGITSEEAKDDYYNFDWLDYTKSASSGDANYVQNVLSFLPENPTLSFKTDAGENVVLNVTNEKSIVKH